ncbi:MAG TPA: arsenosugar biosynthesis radical SAM (seleno)protein ArsS [candidate division Zixibacteria bacterium]|nr:arsenosugar biosynthesis radical SAM (seleno)protein ArsS [candidate division Zixibacteria bacterium]
MQPFVEKLRLSHRCLARHRFEVLQVNMGRLCNLACVHCHVESSPARKETMDRKTVDAVLRFLAVSRVQTLDITGGAPELNENFDYLVESARSLDRHVIDRCNLTVIFEPGKEYLPEFFKRQRVELICSLPCYSEANVDKQRGKGTFELSIQALKLLNRLGYGLPGSGLVLNLVYNPVGPHLPPRQDELEKDYKRELSRNFGIEFNRLYCLANMPITRYETHLRLRGEYEGYVRLLAANFNPETLEQVMCRSLISVGWEGWIYDCDFNQMLGLPLRAADGRPLHISSLAEADVVGRPITVGNHCYACTAGSGSSCGGALVP